MRPEAPLDSVHGDRGQSVPKPRNTKTQRSRRRRVALELLEPRTLMAVLPAPTINISQAVADFTAQGDPAANGNVSTPTISVNPLNSLQLAAVFTVNDSTQFGTTTPIQVEGAVSDDGGQTWASFSPTGDVGVQFEPFTAPGSAPVPFSQVTDASVAWDRAGHFFVLQDQHASDNSSGMLILSTYTLAVTPFGPQANFQGASAPNETMWNLGGSPNPVTPSIYQPTLAVDDNVASFTDPTTR